MKARPLHKLARITTTSLGAAGLLVGACMGDPGAPGAPGASEVLDPELPPLDKAFIGVGGRPAVEALTSFRLTSDGVTYFPGEQFRIADPAVKSNDYHTTTSYDVAHDQFRIDHQRHLVAFGVDLDQTYAELVRGPLGYVSGNDGLFGGLASGGATGELLAGGTAALRKQQRLMNPQLILKDIATNEALASDGGVALFDGELHQLVVVADSVFPITLYVNAATGRIDRLSTRENDHLHRDVDVDVFYRSWTATAGLRFPEQVDLFVNDELIVHDTRTQVEVDVAIAAVDLEFPAEAAPVADAVAAHEGELNHNFHEGFAGIGLRLDATQGFVQATELAPGVFLLGGGSHNSLAIEQANGIVIVEAPLYGARTQAIEAWVATQFPGKRISHVVVTHFHDDHSGGVRELAATGAIVVSDQRSQTFYQSIFTAPSTIDPDTMATAPRPVAMMGVLPGRPVTLTDPDRPIVVRSISNSHAYDMVMVHLPLQHLLFEADLFSPGFPPVLPKRLPTDLRDGIVAAGLTSATIVGAHGGTATFAQLEAAIAP